MTCCRLASPKLELTLSKSASNPHATLYRYIAGAVAGIAVLVLVAVWFWPSDQQPPLSDEEIDVQMEQAMKLMQQGNFAGAETLANELRKYREDLDEALIISGEAAFRQNRLEDALVYYGMVTQDGDSEALTSLWASGVIYRGLGQLSKAEEMFRDALRIAPDDQNANSLLASLMMLTGRDWEARQIAFKEIRDSNLSMDALAALGLPRLQSNTLDELQFSLDQSPDDPLVYLGLARYALNESSYSRAITNALEAIARKPELVEAHTILGTAYLENGFPDGFLAWKNGLPPNANRHPEVWRIIGDYVDSQKLPDQAIRCYWEAARINPNDALVAYRLGRLLDRAGRPEAAEAFRSRSVALRKFSIKVLEATVATPDDELEYSPLIDLAKSLGRIWEAWGWTNLAMSTDRAEPTAEEIQSIEALEQLINENPPLVIPASDPAIKFSMQSFPLPDWLDQSVFGSSPPPAGTLSVPSFRDVAQEAKLDFQHLQKRASSQGMKLFEKTGGGIAIIDFDVDGWPDIYLSQRASLPRAAEKDQPTDRLFRNLGNGQFSDVTVQANLGDQRFSQGVAAGDYNNDGFPDLLVANIGFNRLYENLGDGTFAQVEFFEQLAGDRWTTSCAIVDINRDQIPDVYLSNYIAGNEVYIRNCGTGDRTRPCPPSLFPADPDQLLVGSGNGNFTDESQSSGITAAAGRGLALAIGDFESNGTTAIMAANDLSENQYWILSQQSPPLFEDRAVIQGLASNADGFNQASMGVAVDDADGDGRVDLFLTGFAGEWNTLYLQESDGFFADRSRSSRLFIPSMNRLSFGTQFIDPELDGWPDLFVANGHIEDLSSEGIEFQMAPQFFQNEGEGLFTEAAATDMGDFFTETYLSRSVALLDWNRDGKQDLAVSHLDRPFSLLSNETEKIGNRIELSLVGTDSARDAFGAVVEVETANRNFVKALYAGSGYLASNQRNLIIGLGAVDKVDRLSIRWPSGKTERFETVELNRPLIAIEGESALIALQ